MLTVLAVLFPIVAGIIASAVPVRGKRAAAKGERAFCGREGMYAVISIVTVILSIVACLIAEPVTLMTFSPNVTFTFAFDNLGRVFLAAVLILYTAVAFYAFEYMKMEEKPNVFFAFYYVSLGAMISVAAAGNLVTLYFCFEMATLTSVPLVLHEGTKEAIAAAMKYLFYSIAGALMGLFAVFFVYYYGEGGRSFVMGGFLNQAAAQEHAGILLAACFVGIIGFGTKAGMYPMHGWLPAAHPIAPAPASGLLSGIIAKAGIIAVIRLVYYSYGTEFLKGTWVQYAWMCLAMLTVFMGSMMAFLEKNMKKRLAYSTISQISYIMIALSLMSPEGLEGGLLHMLSHVASKGTLFLCAGVFIYKLGKRNVGDLVGIGRQMPVTMWCFFIAAMSLVGIPPMGGFLSKWVIAGAAIGSGSGVFAYLPPVILLISALLTAGYLFPVAFKAFFPGKDYSGPTEKAEPSALMTVPMIALCAVAAVVGIFGVTLLGRVGF